MSGVRFLFDNLVEDQTQFERNSGFGYILAHSMGLGKSIQVIAFLDLIFRYCRPPPRTVLLIVPINTLQVTSSLAFFPTIVLVLFNLCRSLVNPYQSAIIRVSLVFPTP